MDIMLLDCAKNGFVPAALVHRGRVALFFGFSSWPMGRSNSRMRRRAPKVRRVLRSAIIWASTAGGVWGGWGFRARECSTKPDGPCCWKRPSHFRTVGAVVENRRAVDAALVGAFDQPQAMGYRCCVSSHESDRNSERQS